MTTSIDELVAELKASDLWATMFELADAAGLPVSAMQELEAPRTLITTIASWTAAVWNNPLRQAIMSQYGDLVVNAGRTWATLWGLSLYGVAPDEATFAEGNVTITNTKGGNWSFTPFSFQIKNGVSGKLYTNTESLAIGPWPGSGPFPSTTVAFRSVEPGSASTSGVGAINTVVTSANGLTCSNPAALVGQDEETIADYVQRARLTPAQLSPNGPRAAFELVLRRTLREDGTKVPVTRIKFRQPVGTNVVRVVCAGPSGALTVSDTNRLLTNVRSLCEPWGQVAQIVSAVPVPVNYSLAVFARQSPTLTNTIISIGVSDALIAFLSDYPIGGNNTSGGENGYVYANEMAAKASESNAAIYLATNSAADTAIGVESVPVIGSGGLSITFT